MSLTSPDFESGAYTNFATPARKDAHDKAHPPGVQPLTEPPGKLSHRGTNWADLPGATALSSLITPDIAPITTTVKTCLPHGP